jgi:hypothetical protein
MSIFNRRNALLGWAAWTIAKQTAKRKARKGTSIGGGGRRLVIPAAAAAATATIVGALLLWRKHSRPGVVDEYAQ